MVDFAMDVYKNLYSDDIPHALREKRTTVVAQLKQLQAETEPIVKMFEDPETTRQMQSTRDGRMLFDYLADKHGAGIFRYTLQICKIPVRMWELLRSSRISLFF
uniref:Eukaryotic translation initiation factor 3 subunit E n=1 Tax=Homo sapiens TaxID=9606 RepID=A0A7I2V2Q9_HUMAN